jgi:hypothetical protein
MPDTGAPARRKFGQPGGQEGVLKTLTSWPPRQAAA